eukprot:929257-Rhodomonas_salina.2
MQLISRKTPMLFKCLANGYAAKSNKSYPYPRTYTRVSYAIAMTTLPCPTIRYLPGGKSATFLRTRYVESGTDVACTVESPLCPYTCAKSGFDAVHAKSAICLRVRYVVPGTDIATAASPQVRQGMSGTDVACGVRWDTPRARLTRLGVTRPFKSTRY